MATPGPHDIALYQGDTHEMTLTFTRRDKETDVVSPLNFTGAVGAAQIRRTARDSAVLGEFDVTFPDPVNGVCRMELNAATSQAIGAESCVYDLQITDSGGKVRTYIKGVITVEKGVTR